MTLTDHIILINDRIWMTTKCLEHHGMSINTIKSGYKRFKSGKGQSWEPHLNQKLGGYTLIAMDSIPAEQVTLYGLPSNEEILAKINIADHEDQLVKVKSVSDLWRPFYKTEDSLWFQSKYNVNGNRANGRDRAEELAIGCAILRMLNAYSTKSKIQQYTGFDNKMSLYEAVCQYINNYSDTRLYEMPGTYRHLRPKVKAWRNADKHNEDPRLIFNLERLHENDHALKFSKEHQNVFMEYYLNPRGNVELGQKLPMLTCHRKYVDVMKREFGIGEEECVSVDAIRAHFNKTKERQNLVSLSRNGTTHFDSYVMPYMIRKAPNYSFSLVAGDGWMPGRTVITRRKVWDESKRAYVIKTRTKAITVWIWYDWKSKAIISYKLSPTETGESIRKSFRDILSFWGIVPGAVMVDDKWANKTLDTKRMFERAKVRIEPKPPYSPQTSIAERNNKEVNKYFREEDPFWVNMDRNTHTVNFRHNENWVRGVKPIEEEEFLVTLRTIINRYNNAPLESLNGQTPLEVLQANINPDCRQVDPLELSFLFGDMRGPLAINRYNFDIQVASKKYAYSIGFDYQGQDKNGKAKIKVNDDCIRYDRTVRPSEKVLIYFDENHMETVDVYSYTDLDNPVTHRYMMTAVRQDLIATSPTAFEEGPGKSKSLQDERQDRIKAHYEGKLQEQMEEMEEWDISMESLMNAGQEAEKERMANQISSAFGSFFEERDSEEMVVVTMPEKIKKPEPLMDTKSKKRALEERMKRLNEE